MQLRDRHYDLYTATARRLIAYAVGIDSDDGRQQDLRGKK